VKIAIIGGAGHVGLPFGLVLADAGHDVTLVDTDEDRLALVADGELPFSEPGATALLREANAADRLHTTPNLDGVDGCDVVVFVVGTPIDEHHNPQMETLLDLVDDTIDHLAGGELLVFRSTVYPGTTSIVRDRLAAHGFTPGEDVYLAFCPERVAQHRALEEIVGLPQLVGAFDEESYLRAEAFFDGFLAAACHRLTPTEAELGKLFTNMWRYLTFAAANEFYLVADSFATHHDVNVNRILRRTGEGYPRFDVPSPGANVGGPCLTKDGWFLVDNIPFNELVSAAYQINEGMPAQIIDRMAESEPAPERVGILGMTFKANSDDTRNSVAFKMEKQLRMKGYDDVVRVEPNVDGFDTVEDLAGCDWVILMTPHDEFADLDRVVAAVGDETALYCDIWGFWDRMALDSDNGYFRGTEV
jgi:UDP-N-acetyl-D-mannosaminuronic acid dehydrogenase